MIFIFILTFLFLNIFCAQNKSKSLSENTVFVKSFDCYFNEELREKFIYPNESCSVKTYNRKLTMVDFYLALRKPVHRMFVSLI